MKPDRGTNVVSIAGTETKLAGSCNNNVVYIVYRQKKKNCTFNLLLSIIHITSTEQH